MSAPPQQPPEPAIAPPRRHLRVALFNDTGRSCHVGCRSVSLAHDLMLARLGIAVFHRFYLGEWSEIGHPDPDIASENFARSRLPGLLKEVDAVVINGEGTIHHGAGLHLLAILDGAQKMGRGTFLVNAVYQESPFYIDTLRRLDDCTARDAHSSAYFSSLGAPNRIVPDSILEAPFFHNPVHDFRGKIVITDWHVARDNDVGHALRQMAAALGEKAVFYPLEGPDREHDWRHAVADLRTARLVITGRHHGVYLAALAGTPFVAFGSNTWKIEGFFRMAPGGLTVCSDASQLHVKCREALDNPVPFRQVHDFLQSRRPLSTFQKLASQSIRPAAPENQPLEAARAHDADAALAQANALFQNGQAPAASTLLRRALDQRADWPEGWGRYVQFLLAQNRTIDALSALEFARSSLPRNTDIPAALAPLYAQSGQLAEAEAEILRALSFNPNNASLRALLRQLQLKPSV